MGVCNQITLLILLYVSSSLLTLLNVIDTLQKFLMFVSSSVTLPFIVPSFVPVMFTSFTFYIVLIIYITVG